jgi:hypothetical protein
MRASKVFLLVCGAVWLTGCGNNNDGNTPEPQSTTYQGAATVGDYANFSVSGNTVTYSSTGTVFGSQNGTMNISQIHGPFYEDSGSNTHLFLSDNIGIAKVPMGSSSGYIVGLQQPSAASASLIAGKTYLYIHINSNGVPTGHKIDINANGTYSADSISGSTETGCWKVWNSLFLVAKASTNDCSSVTDTSADYRIVIKPGTNRNGIVVDYVNGSGFGIGLEQKALVAADVASGVYKSYYYNTANGSEGFGETTLTNGNFVWKDCDTSSGICTQTTSGTLAINQLCDGTPVQGVACATDANGDTFNVMLSPDDGYYFAIGDGNYHVELGSNQ